MFSLIGKSTISGPISIANLLVHWVFDPSRHCIPMIPGSPARLKRKWPSPTTAAWSHASRGLKPCHWRRASCWCLPAPGPETCRCHPSTAKICDFSPEKPPDFGKKWHWIINHVDFVIGSWPLWLSAMGWESQWWAPQPQIVRGFHNQWFCLCYCGWLRIPAPLNRCVSHYL